MAGEGFKNSSFERGFSSSRMAPSSMLGRQASVSGAVSMCFRSHRRSWPVNVTCSNNSQAEKALCYSEP